MIVDAAYEDEIKKRLETKWSKNAFKCVKCPREGCPAWNSVFLDDHVRGRRVLEGCGFVLNPLLQNLTMGFSLGAMQTTEAVGKQVVTAIAEGIEANRQLEAQRELKVLNSGVSSNS